MDTPASKTKLQVGQIAYLYNGKRVQITEAGYNNFNYYCYTPIIRRHTQFRSACFHHKKFNLLGGRMDLEEALQKFYLGQEVWAWHTEKKKFVKVTIIGQPEVIPKQYPLGRIVVVEVTFEGLTDKVICDKVFFTEEAAMLAYFKRQNTIK